MQHDRSIKSVVFLRYDFRDFDVGCSNVKYQQRRKFFRCYFKGLEITASII